MKVEVDVQLLRDAERILQVVALDDDYFADVREVARDASREMRGLIFDAEKRAAEERDVEITRALTKIGEKILGPTYDAERRLRRLQEIHDITTGVLGDHTQDVRTHKNRGDAE